MKFNVKGVFAAVIFAAGAATGVCHAAQVPPEKYKDVVDRVIQPVMAKYGVPGMAVAITVAGQAYVFDYGVASVATRQPVSRNTMFELGSVSKTFTATLASYAQVSGALSLSDKVGKYLPLLRGSPFGDEVSLLNLGTHTPGGLPLQVPDAVRSTDELMQYFKAWQPTHPPGTYRTYNNPGIGTLGLITAKSLGGDFAVLMEQTLFSALGLTSTCIDVPATKMADYAQGYTKEDAPIRVAPGVLSSEAYGVKTTATDMIRFVQANMNPLHLDDKLARAILDTHTGYFKVGNGAMTQDLIWEQYRYPVALTTLLQGNSPAMIFRATPVTAMTPPQAPRSDVWINKTGSTNGFGAYVAFIPEKRLGIVMLANKNFPIDARVTAAYGILTALAGGER